MKSMSFVEFLKYMCNGDVAAQFVLQRMMDVDMGRTVRALNTLDDLGIRGSEITKLSDECGYNIELFLSRVERMAKGKVKDPA